MSIRFSDPRAEPSRRVEAYRLRAALDGPIASGLYSMVVSSWCAGPHSNAEVHAEFEPDPFCEVP